MYKIYYTNEYKEARSYDESTLKEALLLVEGLRRNTRNSFVTIVCENPNSVGKPGADSIEDGILPDGTNYEWKKRR